VIEHLPSNHETLSSNLQNCQKKKKKKDNHWSPDWKSL
jgi:hypothetical protein